MISLFSWILQHQQPENPPHLRRECLHSKNVSILYVEQSEHDKISCFTFVGSTFGRKTTQFQAKRISPMSFICGILQFTSQKSNFIPKWYEQFYVMKKMWFYVVLDFQSQCTCSICGWNFKRIFISHRQSGGKSKSSCIPLWFLFASDHRPISYRCITFTSKIFPFLLSEDETEKKCDLSPDIKSRTKISLWKLSIIRYWFIAKDYEHECALNAWYSRARNIECHPNERGIFHTGSPAGFDDESKQIKLYVATASVTYNQFGRRCVGRPLRYIDIYAWNVSI